MAWIIRKNKLKDGKVKLRVVWEWYEDGRRKSKDLPQERWRELGLRPGMDYGQAKKTVSAINHDEKQRRWDEKREAIRRRLEKEDREVVLVLPQDLCDQFDEELEDESDPKQAKIRWRAAKRLVKSAQLPPPGQWHRRRKRIYRGCAQMAWGLDYVKKVLEVMNKFGELWADATGEAYRKVPGPRGADRAAIEDAWIQRNPKDKASEGLTLDDLKTLKGALKEKQFNWVYVSFWLALRPGEVDLQRFQKIPGGVQIYQPKVRQWKELPFEFEEQKEAVDLWQEGVERPLAKTLSNALKKNCKLYAGRKGFPVYAWEQGKDFVEVASWMGHASIERTYRDYMKWKRMKRRAA